MNTATLVQATADIVTVVNIKAGDVYKRLVKQAYGEDTYLVQIGVVRDVMHNGTDAVISAIEFAQSYNAVEPAIKTFGTDSDLKLFAAEPEEVRQHFTEVIAHARRAVKTAEDELAKKQSVLDAVERITTEESARALTSPLVERTAVTA